MKKTEAVLNKKRSAKNSAGIIAAIAVPVLALIVTHFLCGIMYDTNDDRYIAGLISGEITGSASVVEYCGCLITGPLSMLGRLVPGVQVWGYFLILIFVISDLVLINSFSKIVKNLPVSLITCIILNMSMFYMQAEVNFTGIAIFAAVAGYTALINGLLYEDENNKKIGIVIFFLMELISVCIRRDSMLVVQPFGMILLGALAASEGFWKLDGNPGAKSAEKTVTNPAKWLKIMITAVAAAGASFILFLAGNFLGGKNSYEFTEYRRFNDVGTAYFDYYDGAIGYDELKPVFEGTGITESKWNAMTEYTAFDWDEDVKTYKKIENYLYDRLEHPDAYSIIGGIFENTFLLHSFWLVLLLWGLSFFISLAKKKRRYLIPVLMMLPAHMAVWGYIIYMGRIQKRVQYPLFLCEEIAFALIIFAVIRSFGGFEEFLKSRKRKLVFVPALAAVIAGCILISQGQYEECVKANAAKRSLVKAMAETAEYCGQNPDKQYILDQNAFSHYFGGPFTGGFYKPSNYTISGSWFSMMPAHAERMREIISAPEGFYYIVADYGDAEGEGRIKGYSGAYLKEVTGREPGLADSYETSSGNRFLVYKF